jgi:hypothetical protein
VIQSFNIDFKECQIKQKPARKSDCLPLPTSSWFNNIRVRWATITVVFGYGQSGCLETRCNLKQNYIQVKSQSQNLEVDRVAGFIVWIIVDFNSTSEEELWISNGQGRVSERTSYFFIIVSSYTFILFPN